MIKRDLGEGGGGGRGGAGNAVTWRRRFRFSLDFEVGMSFNELYTDISM